MDTARAAHLKCDHPIPTKGDERTRDTHPPRSTAASILAVETTSRCCCSVAGTLVCGLSRLDRHRQPGCAQALREPTRTYRLPVDRSPPSSAWTSTGPIRRTISSRPWAHVGDESRRPAEGSPGPSSCLPIHRWSYPHRGSRKPTSPCCTNRPREKHSSVWCDRRTKHRREAWRWPVPDRPVARRSSGSIDQSRSDLATPGHSFPSRVNETLCISPLWHIQGQFEGIELNLRSTDLSRFSLELWAGTRKRKSSHKIWGIQQSLTQCPKNRQSALARMRTRLSWAPRALMHMLIHRVWGNGHVHP